MQVSAPEGLKLPEPLAKRLESRLCYNHNTFNRPTYFSNKSGITTEVRRVFQYDSYGNLVCPKGFFSKLRSDVQSFGYNVIINDMDEAYYSSEAFAYDLNKLDGRIQLKDKQDECLAAIMSSRGGIIVGPTGFGKSFMFGAVCLAYPNAKIHVVTRRVDVMKRLYGSLSKLIPSLGIVGSGNNSWSRVTVITADSMHKITHDGDRLADILLYDEAHEAVAPSYQAELGKYRKTKKFGFTASPDGRADGAHFMLEAIFGPRIFEMSYSDAVVVDLVVPIKVEWVKVHSCDTSCSDLNGVSKERWGIWRNNHRNKTIADKANQYDDDEQVLIMVKSVEHAVYLKQHLPNFSLCYDTMDPMDYSRYERNGMLDSDKEPLMTPARREQMRLDFEKGKLKKVISTDVWSTGVDFAQLSVLIRADARASKIVDIQAPGRVARKHDQSGKTYGLVIDFMDVFDFTFHNRSNSRRLSYRKMGWEELQSKEVSSFDMGSFDVLEEAFDD
jgi:superfamily II DNA or RNA helicase